MITAALDARTNYPALVIADGTRVVFAGSIELGVFVPRAGAPNNEGTRTVTDEHLRGAAEKVTELCAVEGVDRIVVTEGRLVIPESEPIEVKRWRKVPREYLCKHFSDWPEEGFEERDGWRVGDFAGTRNAAHVLLTALGLAEAPAKGASVRVLREKAPPLPVGEMTGGTVPAPAASRVLGIDPGGNTGIVIAEPFGAGWLQVYSRTIAVDVSDPEQRVEFAQGVAELIRDYKVSRVIVERVASVHGGHSDGDAQKILGAMRAISTGLVASNWLGGMVEAVCLCKPGEPVDVTTAAAAFWRRTLCGGRSTPGNDLVQDKVREHFPLWPAQSSEHERDAAGLILWDAFERAPRPERVRTQSKSRSKRPDACTCPEGHRGGHLKGCPVGRKAGTVQKCKRCGEPRRGHVCTISNEKA